MQGALARVKSTIQFLMATGPEDLGSMSHLKDAPLLSIYTFPKGIAEVGGGDSWGAQGACRALSHAWLEALQPVPHLKSQLKHAQQKTKDFGGGTPCFHCLHSLGLAGFLPMPQPW